MKGCHKQTVSSLKATLLALFVIYKQHQVCVLAAIKYKKKIKLKKVIQNKYSHFVWQHMNKAIHDALHSAGIMTVAAAASASAFASAVLPAAPVNIYIYCYLKLICKSQPKTFIILEPAKNGGVFVRGKAFGGDKDARKADLSDQRRA